jgi:hypothetical protein
MASGGVFNFSAQEIEKKMQEGSRQQNPTAETKRRKDNAGEWTWGPPQPMVSCVTFEIMRHFFFVFSSLS